MKVLITGGSGFIGTNLCLGLSINDWANWQIMVLDSEIKDILHLKNQQNLNLEFVQGDIREKKLIDKIFTEWKPTVIFHLAAVPRVAYSVQHPLETTHSNIIGTLNILEAMRNQSSNIRLINSSSSSIYGGTASLPTKESDSADPQSPYALQKWQAEEWCRMYAKLYNLDIVSLRYFNVIGKYSRYGGAYSTVLSAWLYSMYVNTKIEPFLEGDGTQTRDFCDVSNVVQANILAALYDKETFQGEAFNVAQGKSHSLLQVKEMLEKISGQELHLKSKPSRIGDVKHTLADISKAKSILEYHPDCNFEQQVEKMALWFKNSYNN